MLNQRKLFIKRILITSSIIVLFADFFVQLYHHYVMHHIHVSWNVQIALDIILLLSTWNLFSRKRLAWIVMISAIIVNSYIYIMPSRAPVYFQDWHMPALAHQGVIEWLDFILGAYALIILLIYGKNFKISNATNAKSTQFLFSVLAVVLIGLIFFCGDLNSAINVLTDLNSNFGQKSTAYFIWGIFIIALISAFNPVLIKEKSHVSQRNYARKYIEEYGQNPVSYLGLEDDKLIYYGKDVEGIICYGRCSEVLIVLGDPICAEDDFPKLLGEWYNFCVDNDFFCIFMGTTDKFIDVYKMFGYGYVKYGEEARFDLQNLNLSGKAKAKMRMNINHANKAGLTTHEYKPHENYDEKIEEELNKVSNDWLAGKKSTQLKFSIGDVHLNDPLSRRYFYATDENGKIVAFNVFIPFLGMDGYMADVTRRTNDCPSGVTEKLLYDAFETFAKEGISWGSVGLAPLANIKTGDNHWNSAITKNLLAFLYEKGNAFYGFQDLHKTKTRYGPDLWVDGYLVFTGNELTLQMIYALIRIQSPQGFLGFVRQYFKKD